MFRKCSLRLSLCTFLLYINTASLNYVYKVHSDARTGAERGGEGRTGLRTKPNNNHTQINVVISSISYIYTFQGTKWTLYTCSLMPITVYINLDAFRKSCSQLLIPITKLRTFRNRLIQYKQLSVGLYQHLPRGHHECCLPRSPRRPLAFARPYN